MQPDQIARYEYTGIFSKAPDWPQPWLYLLFAIVVVLIFYSGYRTGKEQKKIEEAEKNFFGESD